MILPHFSGQSVKPQTYSPACSFQIQQGQPTIAGMTELSSSESLKSHLKKVEGSGPCTSTDRCLFRRVNAIL